MKRVASDGWFQMFAAVAALAAVVSVTSAVRERRVQPASATSPPVVAAAAPASPVVAATAQAPADARESVVPLTTQGSSLDLTLPVNSGAPVPAPVQAVPPPPAPAAPPQMTLTGAGVGNTQGIPAAGGGGGIMGFIGGLVGPAVRPAIPAPGFVAPATRGVFIVDASGGGDTRSLRDAAHSAASGDEIRVRPGIYDGPVEITGKNLRIKGLGADAGAVTIRHSGRLAGVVVRNGGLELSKVRVIYGASNEHPPREPHGALYAIASTVLLSRVELGTPGYGEPALIAERGDKPTSLTVQDSELMGGQATVVLRGALVARFVRSQIAGETPVAAWLEAVVDLANCRFDQDLPAVISAYEGASVSISGSRRPRVDGTRGADATTFESYFGSASMAKRGFSRDIFRRGRQPGSIP